MSRPGHVFHRKPTGELPVAVKGEGVFIEDESGRRYLDASGGAVVVNVGHGRREIAEAVAGRLNRGAYFHPTMFTTPEVEELASRLAERAPAGVTRFYFMTSGSEAVETAIKLARQIHVNEGRRTRHRLISRRRSYHGLSLGALAASGRTALRAPFAPMILDAVHIEPPYCMRCPFGLKPEDCGLRCAAALEDAILHEGPETVSAFIAETVSGPSLAVHLPPPGYWPMIREICDRYGVLLIQDEVLTGMGRAGRWFASEYYDVVPDMVTLGKGLSGGTLPLSAVGVREDLYVSAFDRGGFAHGGTFSHHCVSAAAGVAAIDILEKEGLVERAESVGSALGEKLRDALADSPYVADIRGVGLLWGVEFVADTHTLKPFQRSEKVTERLWDHAFSEGTIFYKAIGMAGADGDGLVIAPPFVIREEEMDMAVSALEGAVIRVLGR